MWWKHVFLCSKEGCLKEDRREEMALLNNNEKKKMFKAKQDSM
jgi:hypothetical protein